MDDKRVSTKLVKQKVNYGMKEKDGGFCKGRTNSCSKRLAIDKSLVMKG
jgi:hypothetical protein